MILRDGFLYVFALCLSVVLAGNPARAQTRVGEAAVIQNEGVRVAGSATSRSAATPRVSNHVAHRLIVLYAADLPS